MRLFEIDQSLSGTMAIVSRDCQPYINEAGGIKKAVLEMPMWRGLRPQTVRRLGTPENELVKVPVPVNRRPADTPSSLHLLADEWFRKKFGVRYRSNAFFVTGDIGVAAGYGAVHCLFPIGNFSYCWSENAGDLYETIDDRLEGYVQVVQDEGEMDHNDALKVAMDLLLNDAEYKSDYLSEGIQLGKEIMIHCDFAYVMTFDHQSKLEFQYAAL